MDTATAACSPDEVVERGRTLYEQSIRRQVEDGDFSRLLMIDVTTGNWVMGEDRVKMARRLRIRNPQALNYGMRIGFLATETIGATLRPLTATSQPQ